MRPKKLHGCRVCGYSQPEPPWGEDGKLPSFNTCSCCGVEFGYEDSSVTSAKNFRIDWINSGMKWFLEKERPENWDSDIQFENIPKEFK